METKSKWRRRILLSIVSVLLAVGSVLIFLKGYATPTVREQIGKSLYTVGDQNYEVALSEGKNIVKFGPLPFGLYPGGLAFDDPQEAHEYLEQNDKLDDGWGVYLLSGDFDQDSIESNGKRYTNKSLVVIEKFDLGVSDVKLSYKDFDQTPNRGWRRLADESRFSQAAKLIDWYLDKHEDLTESQIRNLKFHAGQMHAFAGKNETAISYFKETILAEEPEDNPIRWNAYVMATIAFLENDRDALENCRSEIAAGPKMGSIIPNLNVVDSFLDHLGESYQAAYDGHRGMNKR